MVRVCARARTIRRLGKLLTGRMGDRLARVRRTSRLLMCMTCLPRVSVKSTLKA